MDKFGERLKIKSRDGAISYANGVVARRVMRRNIIKVGPARLAPACGSNYLVSPYSFC